MLRTHVSFALAVALVFPAGAPAKDAPGIPFKLMDSSGNPASAVDIAFVTKAASGLKPVTIATTDPQGEATVFLNTFANVGKKEKVQAYMRVCKDGKYTLILVEPGATLKADENCRDHLAGLIPWTDGMRVTVNTGTGSLTTSGGGGSFLTRPVVVATGVGVVGLAVTLGVAGGNSSTGGQGTTPQGSQPPPMTGGGTTTFSPFGPWPNVTIVPVEGNPHVPFIGAMPNQLTASGSAASITWTGAPPWVSVAGSIDASGNFDSSGVGTVAGFPNVSVSFRGTANASGLNGTYRMGINRELPGGQSADYSVMSGPKK